MTTSPGAGEGGPGRAGSLADEAVRLLDALSQSAASWSAGSSFAAEPRECPCCATQTPTTCRGCPLCRLVDHLQTVRPEVLQHLGDALASISAALAELVPAQPSQARGAGHAAEDEDRHHTGVQHIDVTD
ncbi:MAG: hypothetical protein ACLGIA_03260 [Actinomycetes bacterium]